MLGLGVRIGPDQHEHERRPQAVRDPHLRAVDLVGVRRRKLLGRGLDRRHVGPELGLGQAERRAHLAGGHLRQVLLLLLVGAELHQQVGPDEVRVDDPRDRDPAARELLDDHRVGRQVEPHPVELLGDRHPEQPELLHLLDDRLGELVLVVVVLGVREDLLVGELAHHLADRLLLVGPVGVGGRDSHGRGCSSVSGEQPRIRQPAQVSCRFGRRGGGLGLDPVLPGGLGPALELAVDLDVAALVEEAQPPGDPVDRRERIVVVPDQVLDGVAVLDAGPRSSWPCPCTGSG